MSQSQLERIAMRLRHTRHPVTFAVSEAGLTAGPAAPSRGLCAKGAQADPDLIGRGGARCVGLNKISSDS